jgi:hypothetical protein
MAFRRVTRIQEKGARKTAQVGMCVTCTILDCISRRLKSRSFNGLTWSYFAYKGYENPENPFYIP